MKRRAFLLSLPALALSMSFTREVSAHTPYRQWKILRQRFLLVHSSRSDPVSDEIAESMVEILDRVLPKARAMVARAPDEQRIASLMTTGQAVLAVMRTDLVHHHADAYTFERIVTEPGCKISRDTVCLLCRGIGRIASSDCA